MNPLLLTLEASGLGLSVKNLYGGAYPHADDIRNLASTASTLQAHISEVLKFTSNNFLQLNPAKCEIISFPQRNTVHDPVREIEGKLLPAYQPVAQPSAWVIYGTITSQQSHQLNTTFLKQGNPSLLIGAWGSLRVTSHPYLAIRWWKPASYPSSCMAQRTGVYHRAPYRYYRLFPM